MGDRRRGLPRNGNGALCNAVAVSLNIAKMRCRLTVCVQCLVGRLTQVVGSPFSISSIGSAKNGADIGNTP